MNTTTIPTCDLCNHSVGEAEYDHESRGYFSRHNACVQPDYANGRFVVVSFFDGEQCYPVAKCEAFTYAARAEEVARSNAGTNRCRWYFRIWDREARRYIAGHRGHLRETAPSGRPFYGEVWTVRDSFA